MGGNPLMFNMQNQTKTLSNNVTQSAVKRGAGFDLPKNSRGGPVSGGDEIYGGFVRDTGLTTQDYMTPPPGLQRPGFSSGLINPGMPNTGGGWKVPTVQRPVTPAFPGMSPDQIQRQFQTAFYQNMNRTPPSQLEPRPVQPATNFTPTPPTGGGGGFVPLIRNAATAWGGPNTGGVPAWLQYFNSMTGGAPNGGYAFGS